jgi:hypothetical protein
VALCQYCKEVEIAGSWCWARSGPGCTLTQHLHELIHNDGDFVLEHDKNHEADIDDVKRADQVLRDWVA